MNSLIRFLPRQNNTLLIFSKMLVMRSHVKMNQERKCFYPLHTFSSYHEARQVVEKVGRESWFLLPRRPLSTGYSYEEEGVTSISGDRSSACYLGP